MKNNQVILSGQLPIHNPEELEKHISQIEKKILEMPSYKEIENMLSDSKGMALKDVIETRPELIEYLSTDKLPILKNVYGKVTF